MNVPAGLLLRGTWYAIEQCGYLLQDAITLYRTAAYPSAIALAMIAREELGKYRILLDLWKKSTKTPNSPSDDDIRAASGDHVEKQRQAQLCVTFMAAADSRLDRLFRTRFKHQPQDPEYKEADAEIQKFIQELSRRTPGVRHAIRKSALYVDLNESGTNWNRPREMGQADAYKCLADAANDYAGQIDRLRPDLLRALEEFKLATALDEWPERPALPNPVWPELP